MADASGSDDSASEYITITPKVFLSYRRADARDVAEILSERLRKDLGSTNVFRDEEDLIAGQVWRDVLADTIALSDATLILVGNDWTGEQPDGSRRIDEPTDVVRVEVNRALASANHGVAVPILIDITAAPESLPSDIAALFEHHAVKATREDLQRRASVNYHEVLVAVWEAFRARVERGVILVGATHAGARVEALVAVLKAEGVIAARKLSRFASGAVIVSASRARRGRRRWPRVIVVVDRDDAEDETFRALLFALYRHPTITSIALVSVGATAATMTVLASGATGSGTTVTTHTMPELVASLPGAGSGATGAMQARWSNAGTGTKIAVAVGSLGAVTVAGAIATALIDDEETHPTDFEETRSIDRDTESIELKESIASGETESIESEESIQGETRLVEFAETTSVSAANDPEPSLPDGFGGYVQLYPLGYAEAVVTLGLPQPVDGSNGDVRRDVSVQFRQTGEPVDLGTAILPTVVPDHSNDVAGNATTRVEVISQNLKLPALAGTPAGNVCTDSSDPSLRLAGWRFTGDPITVEVRFDVIVHEGEMAGTEVIVVLVGPAVREPLRETGDREFGPDCPEVWVDARSRLYPDQEITTPADS